ncbi:MAG: UbiA family prenyltransferase [Candidatus Krumholzibacteria bacterium]|nr:UbiA family prenyltransferase [Candidatus Krumholzibacteria bacterium]
MLARILLRAGDYIFVLRPLILVPVWSFYLLGARSGALAAPPGGAVRVFPALACLTLLMASAYLINQVFDRRTDALNEKGHYLTRGIFSARWVVGFAVALFFAAAWVNHTLPAAQRAAMVAALVLAMAYSLPPARLCARPFLDLLANALGYGGVAFAAGRAVFDPSLAEAARASLPWVLLVGATFLHTTILDVEGDRAAGKRTTAVAMGATRAARGAAVLALAATAAAAAQWRSTGDTLALLVTAPLAAAYARWAFARWTTPRSSAHAVQGATALVALAAAWNEPRLLAVVIPLVLIARLYYRRRFGVPYPGPADDASATA